MLESIVIDPSNSIYLRNISKSTELALIELNFSMLIFWKINKNWP